MTSSPRIHTLAFFFKTILHTIIVLPICTIYSLVHNFIKLVYQFFIIFHNFVTFFNFLQIVYQWIPIFQMNLNLTLTVKRLLLVASWPAARPPPVKETKPLAVLPAELTISVVTIVNLSHCKFGLLSQVWVNFTFKIYFTLTVKAQQYNCQI